MTDEEKETELDVITDSELEEIKDVAAEIEKAESSETPESPESEESQDYKCPKCGENTEKAGPCPKCGTMVKKAETETDKPELTESQQEEFSAYTAFIKKFLKEHKDKTLKDAAKAWKKEKGEDEEIPSTEKATEVVKGSWKAFQNLLVGPDGFSAVPKGSKYPYPGKDAYPAKGEKPEMETAEKLNLKISEMEKTIKELKSKIDDLEKPERKGSDETKPSKKKEEEFETSFAEQLIEVRKMHEVVV